MAILLVIGAHNKYQAPETGPVAFLHNAWSLYGWTGVDMFFVLSGFLVGGLLFREMDRTGGIDAKRFLSRRAFKIWPLYFVYIGAELILFGHRGGWHFEMSLLPNLLHLQNYLGSPLGHTWSLAVEEHFYLLLAFAMAWAASRWGTVTFKLVAWSVAVVVLTCNLLRIPVSGDQYAGIAWATRATHLRLDGLAVGVLLAALYHLRPDLWQRLAAQRWLLACIFIFGVGFIAFFPKEGAVDRTLGYTTLYMGYAALLVLLEGARDGGWRQRFLRSSLVKMAAAIGIWSYGIYLWHISASARPIDWVLERSHIYEKLGPSAGWLLASCLYASLAIGLGLVMTIAVEKPFLALRERVAPPREQGLPTER